MSCDHHNHYMKIKSPKTWNFKKCPPAKILLHAFQMLVLRWPLWQKFGNWQDAMRHWLDDHSQSSMPVQKSTGGTSRNERFHLQTCPQSNITAQQCSPRMTSQQKRGSGPNGDQWSLEFITSEDMNLGNRRLPWAIIPTSKGVESHLFQAKHLLLRASMKALRSKTPKSCSQHRNSTGLSNLAFWQNLTERQRSIRTRQNEIEWGAVQK